MEKAATAPREIKRKRSRLPGNKMTPLMAIIIVLLFIYFLLVAYPLFWMICNSLKSYKEIYKNIWAMPKSPLWNNYALAWQRGISKYFLNSVLVTGSTIVGAILSPQVTLIPLYKIIQALHIHNTYLALIIPYTAYRIPLIVMLIRSHFLSIPKEIEESAILDGCSSFKVFYNIFLPMSKPILLTCTILTAYYAWNEFLYAIIFIDSDKFRTIPAGLMNLRDALQTDWGVLLAGMTISAAPLIILFLLMQKQFIRGMTAGSVKG